MDEYVSLIVKHSEKVLPLSTAQLGDEYFYQSLPLCIIDAVYSIGVRYEGVRNTVIRYCTHFNIQRIRAPKHSLPQSCEQESVSHFCEKFEKYGLTKMTDTIFNNRQRTSSKNGILKAEAAYQFASILREHEVEHLQDVDKMLYSQEFEQAIRNIPGQKSGISLQYFFMLSGSDAFVKPDRMIMAFLKNILGRSVGFAAAQELLTSSSIELRNNYPHLTPRLLDHEIWKYQREHKENNISLY